MFISFAVDHILKKCLYDLCLIIIDHKINRKIEKLLLYL